VCGECAFGYSGDDCSANGAIPVVVLLVITFVAGFSIAGVIVYFKFIKNKRPEPYELLSTMDDEEAAGTLKSNAVIDSTREKLDFGPEIDGDDDIISDAADSDVIGMNLDVKKEEEKPEEAQSKPHTVVDLLSGDDPIDDGDDEDFFAYKH